jgi:putative hydrolase of HD superfamily
VLQEKKAMDGILGGLPPAVNRKYGKIWSEYLENRTDLARFVHRIDKLEMAMQASQYAAQGYDKQLLEPFFTSAKKAVGNSDDIVSQTFARLVSKNM